MHLTIISATHFEIEPLILYLKSHFSEKNTMHFEKKELKIDVVITGVGMPLTAFVLGNYFSKNIPDLAINAGIAGALNLNLKIGDVVNVISERFGDLGVEEADGTFTDVHEMGLIDSNEFPFLNGVLHNPKAVEQQFLPPANGLTINKVHGFESSVKLIKEKYPCDVESMEGAAFFLACLMSKIDFLSIRSISNFVEKRDKEKWDISLAIQNLNQVLIEMVEVYV